MHKKYDLGARELPVRKCNSFQCCNLVINSKPFVFLTQLHSREKLFLRCNKCLTGKAFRESNRIIQADPFFPIFT